jgi:Polyketide cyclase / dehydrase and lipid transport
LSELRTGFSPDRHGAGSPPIEASADVSASPAVVFEYLSALDNHWRLADRWIEVLSLDAGPGASAGDRPDRGRVRMRGPLGLTRTAVTRVLVADPPTSIAGSAAIGRGTVATVGWTLHDLGGGTRVGLAAELESASLLDRVLLSLGGRQWLRRRFSAVLGRLVEAFVAGRELQEAPLREAFDRA